MFFLNNIQDFGKYCGSKTGSYTLKVSNNS